MGGAVASVGALLDVGGKAWGFVIAFRLLVAVSVEPSFYSVGDYVVRMKKCGDASKR